MPRLEALEDRTVLSTLTVTRAADDGSSGTLRAVIASASPGDTIQFARHLQGGDTITLTQGQLSISQNLDIEGPGSNKLTISGNAASRVFDISGGATVTIARLTIADGVAQAADVGGGGIVNESGAILDLNNDTLSANQSASLGGGLWNQSGATTNVVGCTFADNQAIGVLNVVVPTWSIGLGGGIDNDGVLNVSNSAFSGNQAIGGGGAVLSAGGGGGIYSNFFDISGTSLSIAGSTFTDNLAFGGPVDNGITFLSQGLGGGVGNEVGNCNITDSTFVGNQAVGGAGATSLPALYSFIASGGGISSLSGAATTINNSTIAHNQAIGGAGGPGGVGSEGLGGGLLVSGGLFAIGGSLTLSGSSFSDNTALGGDGGSGAPGGDGVGGGVSVDLSATASITNTVVDHNQALGGTGGAGASGGNAWGGGLAVANGSLIGFSDNASVSLSGSTISHNLAVGGDGATGGNGGNGSGGAVFVGVGGSFTDTGSTVTHNNATGGDGEDGGNGGNGLGGGIYLSSGASVSLTGSTITKNRAQGGDGDDGGSDGQGIGGGVYNFGTFTFDATTVIDHNHASTSNDNIFP